MRISDWSSDVCSSDLRCVFVNEFIERHHLLVDGALFQSHLARRHEPDRLGHALVRHVLHAANRPDRAIRGVVALAAVTPRSEEHTSELQSLMRISYAVFCLKKKKRKKISKDDKHNIPTNYIHKHHDTN